MMGESFARRPGVSLFFMCALTFWLGAALALTLLREHDARIVLVFSIMLAAASLLFLAISYAKIQGGRLKAPIVLLSALLMGAGLGAFGAYSVLCAQIEAESSFGMRCFRMEEDLIPRNDRYELLASYEDEAGRKHYVNLIFHENPWLLLYRKKNIKYLPRSGMLIILQHRPRGSRHSGHCLRRTRRQAL